ncbi:EF-Hand 1, calcium-binding site [Phytophthora cactorum]|nr:EF-Hand 1, calcium-binding site [Phytophthora cactorum]
MEFLRRLGERHEALKKKIHSTRIPLSKNGQRVMGLVYFTTPIIGGYYVMKWAERRADANFQRERRYCCTTIPCFGYSRRRKQSMSDSRVDAMETKLREMFEVRSGYRDEQSQAALLAKHFRSFDRDSSGIVDFDEFARAMLSLNFVGVQAETEALFDRYDADLDGVLSYAEFAQVVTGCSGRVLLNGRVRSLLERVRESILEAGGKNGIRTLGVILRRMDQNGNGVIEFEGSMPKRRILLVKKAFALLDTSGDGKATVEEIERLYDASQHPEVLAGRMKPRDAMLEMMSVFEQSDSRGDGVITWHEFLEYYKDLSVGITNDDEFELMIRNAWHLSGGVGWSANSSCRRVLATFAMAHSERTRISVAADAGEEEAPQSKPPTKRYRVDKAPANEFMDGTSLSEEEVLLDSDTELQSIEILESEDEDIEGDDNESVAMEYTINEESEEEEGTTENADKVTNLCLLKPQDPGQLKAIKTWIHDVNTLIDTTWCAPPTGYSCSRNCAEIYEKTIHDESDLCLHYDDETCWVGDLASHESEITLLEKELQKKKNDLNVLECKRAALCARMDIIRLDLCSMKVVLTKLVGSTIVLSDCTNLFAPIQSEQMDGAAARGRVSLLQWLRSNRSEGCSPAAFEQSSTKCGIFHLRRALMIALKSNYPDVLTEAAAFAAAHDRKDLLKILLASSDGKMIEEVLLQAASDAKPALVTLLLGKCDQPRMLEFSRRQLVRGFSDWSRFCWRSE